MSTDLETPTLLAAGKFSLYRTPKGAIHLALLVDGESEPKHVEIPAMALKMFGRNFGKNIETISSL